MIADKKEEEVRQQQKKKQQSLKVAPRQPLRNKKAAARVVRKGAIAQKKK